MSKKGQYKIKKRHSKTGMPPGTHVYTGQNMSDVPVIELFEYDLYSCVKTEPDIDELLKVQSEENLWINVFGISNTKVVNHICDKFGVHHLFQEDILNVFQRPKVEEDKEYIFLTFKALEWNTEDSQIAEEQISLILTKNAVITFQEKAGDGFTILRERLMLDSSALRTKGVDYLFYRIVDISVDNYFDILEKMGDYLEYIETQAMQHLTSEVLVTIQNNKKDIMQLRKSLYPMREVLNNLISMEHILISDQTKKYFKDVSDHTIQILETIETYRDINISLKDVYLNAMSHEMNRIMKILTIISTIFIPLTFVVGVYGMNFKYMPELDWPTGYFVIWGVMIMIVLLLSAWFWRKGWFR
ncbi:MAG: magnesium/cobalt transporter CorA [Saprospiraceae bacterium]